MDYVNKFIQATTEYNTFEKNIPAPYIRKSFVSDGKTVAKIYIAACGFYELYLNGKRYTKGFLHRIFQIPNITFTVMHMMFPLMREKT